MVAGYCENGALVIWLLQCCNCIVIVREVREIAVSYNKLYKGLEEKNITMIELRKAADIAPNTMTYIRKNEEVSLDVLGRICGILHSDFGDIMEYEEETMYDF